MTLTAISTLTIRTCTPLKRNILILGCQNHPHLRWLAAKRLFRDDFDVGETRIFNVRSWLARILFNTTEQGRDPCKSTEEASSRKRGESSTETLGLFPGMQHLFKSSTPPISFMDANKILCGIATNRLATILLKSIPKRNCR